MWKVLKIFIANCSTPAIVPSTTSKLVISLIIAWISTQLHHSLSHVGILLIWGQTMGDWEKVNEAVPPKTMKKNLGPLSSTFS